VICDQFVDRTRAGRDTFFDGPKVRSSERRNPTAQSCDPSRLRRTPGGFSGADAGTMGVVQGPRFSTRASRNVSTDGAASSG